MANISWSVADALLAIGSIKGIGIRTVNAIAPLVADSTSAGDLADRLSGGAPVSDHYANLLQMALVPDEWESHLGAAYEIRRTCERFGIAIISRFDPGYPVHLKRMSDRDEPPPILYAKGRMQEDDRTVAVVGTRHPDRIGEQAARRLSAALCEAGWTIVSGLALGVDTIGHQTALDSEARTVAILGNGLDRVYPSANRDLADRILADGGALLSEQPPGAEPKPQNLVKRDRLQSGMSVGTMIIQTSKGGGTMHTARYTQKQGGLLAVISPPDGKFEPAEWDGNLELLGGDVFVISSSASYPPLLDALEARMHQRGGGPELALRKQPLF